MVGNGFHCIVMALLMSAWAYTVGYLSEVPKVRELWTAAGYPYDGNRHAYEWERLSEYDSSDREEMRQSLGNATARSSMCGRDWSRRFSDLGIPCVQPDATSESMSILSPPEKWEGDGEEESCLHLVQDEEVTEEILKLQLPPDEYYDELARLWKE